MSAHCIKYGEQHCDDGGHVALGNEGPGSKPTAAKSSLIKQRREFVPASAFGRWKDAWWQPPTRALSSDTNVIGMRCQTEKTATPLEHSVNAGQHAALIEHVLESTDANRQIDRLIRNSSELLGIVAVRSLFLSAPNQSLMSIAKMLAASATIREADDKSRPNSDLLVRAAPRDAQRPRISRRCSTLRVPCARRSRARPPEHAWIRPTICHLRAALRRR